MPDLQALVAPTCTGLADLLAGSSASVWDTTSLCAGWQVRHVVAHVTMPARLTPEQFGEQMAQARGDFTAMSDAVAARDGDLPREDLLAALRSPALHAWQPPGGGSSGALSHAVIHSLDVTLVLGQPAAAPQEAVDAVRDLLVGSDGTWFGVRLDGSRLEATDTGWTTGAGAEVRSDSGGLVALLSGRTLPDGQSLPRR